MLRCLIIAVASTLIAIPASAKSHTVRSGDSLWTIARKHGCTLNELKRANKLGKFLRPGQKLRIPRCSKSGSQKSNKRGKQTRSKKYRGRSGRGTYVVKSGDTLGRIAARHHQSIKKLKKWNGLKGNLIRAGQRLRVSSPSYKHDGRPVEGQSVGGPPRGRLAGGKQMQETEEWHIRRPHNAWGTAYTIYHLEAAIAAVRAKYPDIHPLSVGDLSAKKGGRLYPHKSHQSGRDADIGFYFDNVPAGYPKYFARTHGSGFHVAANWLFLRLLLKTANTKGGLQVVFLDYKLQKVLYEYVKENGASDEFLLRAFQYPRGISTRVGLIRHEPGHDNHYHFRFKCGASESHCYR